MTRARGPVGEDAPLRRTGITRGLMNNGHRSIDRYQFDFDRSWIRNKRNFVSSTVFSLSYLFFLWFLHRRSASLVKAEKKRRDVDGFLTISSQLAPRKKSPTEICGFSGNFSAGKNARFRDFPRASSFFSAKFLDTLLRDQRSRMTNGVDTSMIERFVFFPLADNWEIGMVNLSYWSNWIFHTDIILQHVELYTMANKL